MVAGTSPLWRPIHSSARELLRSMLNHVNLEILKRARPPRSTFDFACASVGNLFLTGARLFTGSFEAAIYLLALVCGIADHAAVLPAINSNFSHHISAGLANGAVITGQNAISHPSGPSALPGRADREDPSDTDAPTADESGDDFDDDAEPHPEDANLPGTLPTLRTPNIHFTKPSPLTFSAAAIAAAAPSSLTPSPTSAGRRPLSAGGAAHADHALPAPIERIWYINPYGQEIRPRANPKAVAAVRGAAAVVYSVGSLYTSIVPSVVLRGIGAALAADVEGGASGSGGAGGSGARTRRKVLVLNGSADRETGGMGAASYVAAIARAGEEIRGWRAAQGADGVERAVWRKYVTHVVYMEGEGVPKVEKRELAEAGIECVRCWGKRGEDGVWRYDAKGLVGALDAALGKGKDGELSRRNTLKN